MTSKTPAALQAQREIAYPDRSQRTDALIEDIIDSFDNQTSIETAVNYVQTIDDDVIYSTASLTVTLLDPTTARKICRFRSISGTMTLTPASGTTETTSLTVGQAQTMGPRATGWFDL